MSVHSAALIAWFVTLGRGDVSRVGDKNASPSELVQRIAPSGVRVREGFAMLVSMTVLVVCLGAYAATAAGAQYSPPTLNEHHQWERQMMQDMSREMIEMTEQMARSDVTPEQRRAMAKRMEDMANLMHGMSKIRHRVSSLHRQAMTDPQSKNEMEQMRNQMNQMVRDRAMKSPPK